MSYFIEIIHEHSPGVEKRLRVPYPSGLAFEDAVDGSVAILPATVTLTDAQTKALPTAPVELLAAPGAGKLIRLVNVLYELNFAAAYTNITDASWEIGYAGVGAGVASGLTLMATRLGETGHIFAPGYAPYVFGGTDTFDGEIMTVNKLSTDAINAPIRLQDTYAGGTDYTGGDAANEVKVHLLYTIIDV